MPEVTSSRYMVQAGWDDVPHLDAKTKAELLRGTPPYLRDARSKGIPTMGAGMIYPIPWEEVTCDPFQIPDFWPRGYGMDVGWKHPTAAIWLAKDPVTGVLYAYSEYRQRERKPLEHSEAIKLRGKWITGAVDPSANNTSIADGNKLLKQYRGHGLNLIKANNEVHSALDYIWTQLSTGRLVLFSTLTKTESEYVRYRRVDKKNSDGVVKPTIIKVDDDLMDALRYGVMTFDQIGAVKPAQSRDMNPTPTVADPTTGY